MALFKCKICGGALEIDSAQSVATCEYCGTKQTLPRLDDERRANLYDRANHFRRNNDFDKAMGIFEQILNEEPTDAEAYWSIVLCRYGIEYVEDPATRRRVPTVNRAQFTSIFDDEDYKSAIANADGYQREIYEAEANAINELQKNILAISQKEEPFDVFICYKETDNNGRRTQDSVLATELYHELAREGFKVFFSRITLEDKLGQEYEPYIFAALNSAKVMVVLGTKPEHFNAVWVKNEWSRFLALIKNGARKMLIPAYRDMDPYDLPEEFSHLQAQDMSKLGFMQDLTRGIKKIIAVDAKKETVRVETVEPAIAVNVVPLLERAFLFLEDGEFDRAGDFCEQVLNQDPQNAKAYLAKLMIDFGVRIPKDLVLCEAQIEKNGNYQKAIRFGDDDLKQQLQEYRNIIQKNCEDKKKEDIYLGALKKLAESKEENTETAIELLDDALKDLGKIVGWKNSTQLIKQTEIILKELYIKQECEAKEQEKIDLERAAKKQKIARVTLAVLIGLCILAGTVAIIVNVIIYEWVDGIRYTKNNDGYCVDGASSASGEITIPEEIEGIPVVRVGAGAFQNNSYLTSISLPSSIKSIGWGAFGGCYNLQQIELSPSLVEIDICAFEGCSSLTSVTIPESVTSIGWRAFSGCTGLKTVTFAADSKLTSIGWSAFDGCMSLMSITIPSSVTSIGFAAFSGCTGLASITLPFVGGSASATTESDSTLFGYIFGTSNYTGGTATKQHYDSIIYTTYYIPKSLKSVTITGGNIHFGAFECCTGLTNITISLSVTSVGNRAFSGCTGLTSITIPSSVTSIGSSAFEGCTGLTSITIPSSVTSIGSFAFEGCTGLTSITIPSSVTSIGHGAFSQCSSLESIMLPFVGATLNGENDKHFGYIFGADSYFDNEWYVPSSLKTVIIASGTSIGTGAFHKCSSLTSITIPESVTSIGSSAFYGCSSLTNVTFENTNGWYSENGISIPATNLADPFTAAIGLVHSYALSSNTTYAWYRS
ncbi:MAG: leucine-rich repeat protein [Clostridia bacterium]|nr:leucine-rich repeat protein [Clostridia bacterium]